MSSGGLNDTLWVYVVSGIVFGIKKLLSVYGLCICT